MNLNTNYLRKTKENKEQDKSNYTEFYKKVRIIRDSLSDFP